MADYPITAVTRRKVYSGSAGVGPYAFTFPILVQTDIVVYKNSTLLTLTTDYTVTINGTNGTGSVTLVSAASASDTITIIGARAIQRTTDFVTAGDLAASSLNEQLDANIIMTQQLAEENKRTLKAPPYDPEATVDGGTLNMTLPAKADRAGKVLAFDSNGNPSAGAVSLPTSLTATYYPRVNTGGTAYELRAPASVRSDIGADNASNLTSGTVSDSRLPATIDGKTLTNVTITSGSITGITDLAIADGGTGASSASAARTNLGLAIGTNVQAYNAGLADIAGLALTDGNIIVGNGTNWVAESGATARASLGLTIGTDVQAYDQQLADIAGLSPTDGNFIVGDGTNFVAESGATARTSLGLGSIATQNANNVSITGGSISGVTFTQSTPLTIPGTASATGEIRLAEDTDNGTNYVGLKAPASISADVSWTLPASDGVNGQFLSTNGSGTLSWSSPAGAGDVTGPASSTDNALVRFDGTSGKAIQNSGATLSDTGVLTATEVSTDTISEKTAAAGVTIDSVVLKDGGATLTAPVILADGSASAPSVTNTGDTNTGMYFPAADEVAITAGGTVAAAFNSHSFMGMRNRIINGDMRIDQRNAGASVTSATAYPVDRFLMSLTSNVGTFSAQQSTTVVPTGFTHSVGITVTAADSSIAASENFGLQSWIEGYNIADLGFGSAAAKTVTLSFWVRSSVTGTYGVVIGNSNAGTGSANRSYVSQYTITASNTWEYKTVTIPGDTSGTWQIGNLRGMLVRFGLAAGTDFQQASGSWGTGNAFGTSSQTQLLSTLNATWYLTGVQLEVGSVATPFERRQYGQELALCQRYMVRYDAVNVGISQNSQNIFSSLFFPVEMRAAPTLTSATYTVGSGNVGTVSSQAITTKSLNLFNSANNWSTGVLVYLTGNVAAEL